jgi:hypothetical protein
MATNEDWAQLGIAPTTDAQAIRRAYTRALKTVKPDSDPTGFQALRQAYERILSRQAAPTTALASDDHAAEIGGFLSKLAALRYAGDIDAAIGAIEGLFATRQPGDPVLDGIGDALFQTMALERSLSVRLFCHLVERFDWRDASGRAAEADPQQHSILLARVAAEDWYQELLTQAAKPGEIVAACAVARGGVLPLASGGLDKPHKEEAKVLMNALWERGEFLLERFDARTLAALRAAVEGPPLIAPSAEVAARPAAQRLPRREIPRARRLAIAIALASLVICSVWVIASWSTWVRVSEPTDYSPRAQARRVLDQTTSQWVEIRPFKDGTTVNFIQLILCSAAIREIRYGLDRAQPDQLFPLPANATTYPTDPRQTKVSLDNAPATLRSVSVQIVYADGSISPVQVYRRGVK